MNDEQQAFKEFLLEEYKRYSELFIFNEKAGEQRLTFFISLVTAVVGAIIALYAKGDSDTLKDDPIVTTFVILALAGLLGIGQLVYARLIKRGYTTDEYKNNIDEIRKYFIAIDKWDIMIKDLKRLEDQHPKDHKKRKVGSLKDIVALINIFLMIFLLCAYSYLNDACCPSSIILGIVTFVPVVTNLYMLMLYERVAYKNETSDHGR